MINYLAPMTLSDLLDSTVRLTGKIFGRGMILAAIVMLPAGLVAGFAFREFVAAIADTIHYAAREPDSAAAVLPLIYGGIECAIAMLLFGFAAAMLTAACIDLADAEIHFAERSWQGAFSRSWRAAFMLIGQGFIKILLLVSIFAVASALHKISVVLLVPAIPVAIVLGIWLAVSWSLGAQAIVSERHGPMNALYRSKGIVSGNWWRVVGILLLFGFFVQFALSLITTPIYGFSLFPALMGLAKMHPDSENFKRSFDSLLPLLSSMAWILGFLIALSTALGTLLRSVYKTLLYYDLRARHGEFEVPEPAPAITQ